MDPRSITIRASLTLALLAGCGDRQAAGPRVARPATAETGSDQASPDTAPPPSAPVPALPGDGERAFVSDATGLVEISTAGGSQVVAPAASWCAVDARASVVWFVDAGGLHAFDLADRRTRTIIKGDLGEVEVIIDWGEQQLGGESTLAFDVGAAIRLADETPAIEVEMGCEGDRATYCFEEDLETPTAEVAKLQRFAGTLKLADPAYVATLASRGKQGSLWSPPPVPPATPKKKPRVDEEQCSEDPETCGALTAIPASPLWLVQTANSRGDYYHETRTLWDPATGEYLRRDGARLVRSKTPPSTDADTDYGGLRASPSGVLSFGGAVFDAAKVHYAPQDPPDGQSISCGFTGGGWRIAGPTDG
jgi:hypothetical protein